uniref:Uncharacterized protein n=1 Tax=Maylandia zebra TaxID=106582 RepID=A0A3P9B8F4_9CICH
MCTVLHIFCYYMQHFDPGRTSKSTMEWLKKKRINVQSADLNPAECWQNIKNDWANFSTANFTHLSLESC